MLPRAVTRVGLLATFDSPTTQPYRVTEIDLGFSELHTMVLSITLCPISFILLSFILTSLPLFFSQTAVFQSRLNIKLYHSILLSYLIQILLVTATSNFHRSASIPSPHPLTPGL